MAQRSCCVPGCSLKLGEGLPLHRFPNPNNPAQIDRFRTWVMKIGGDIIGEDNNFIHRNRKVCHKHFEDIYTLPNKKITALAIPTLAIPGVHVGEHRHIELPSTSLLMETAISSRPVQMDTAISSRPVMNIEMPIQMETAVSTGPVQMDTDKSSNPEMPEVKLEEVRRFMEDSLKALGTPESEAKAHADLLMHADTVGHYSHGLNRLEFYINDIKSGATVPAAKPEILKEAGATAWVDGHNALGATVGNFCMNLAILKAKEFGVGWVAAKRSNHFGMAGYWALQAEREGLIGMAFTNTSPIMVPTRSKQRALGTNPIGMAAPASGGDKLVVDMATTSVAMGKIEVQIHKGEPLPQGWALDLDGEPTTDAEAAFKAGKLMPLGGDEKTSGYKGYALAAMVEMFCSGLSGSNMTHNIRCWELDSIQGSPDLGQCFAAINPNFFAPNFEDRAADCLNTWRNLEPVDPSLPVLAPGDKEYKIGEATSAKGTVNYPQKQIEAMNDLAKRIGVKPLKTV